MGVRRLALMLARSMGITEGGAFRGKVRATHYSITYY
jgi:hypothetical protein